MSKYHINPETGDVGRCRAFTKCRWSDEKDHFDTAIEASLAYEKAFNGLAHQTFSAAKANPFTAEELADYDELFNVSNDFLLDTEERTFQNGRHEAFRELYKKSTAQTQIALDIYCGEDHSAIINGLLSKTISPRSVDPEILRYYRTAITELEGFIAKHSKSEDTFVYKGATLNNETEKAVLIAELERRSAGDEITFEGFTSTSTAFMRAADFMGPNEGVIYSIAKPSGAFINESAEEMLIARDARFRLVGFEAIDGIRKYVHIKLVQEI